MFTKRVATPLKVAILTPSVSRAAGGIFDIERRTAQSLAGFADLELRVYGTIDQHTEADLPSWLPIRPLVFPFKGPQVFRFSPALQRAFLANDCDLVHANTLWTHASVILRRWKRMTGKPNVITINGMLDGWAVNNSQVRKRVAAFLYERANLDAASCLHVNTEMELRSVREYGLRNPACIIPNGVDLPSDLASGSSPWAAGVAGRPVLLFLSRLHPKKNLPSLLTAWAALQRRQPCSWLLAIVGWDQGGHEAILRRQTVDLGISDSVRFCGPSFGQDRGACYRDASAFILPSFSEGLPMVVLEAWAHAKPVLMTSQCNLPEGFVAGAALRISTDPEGIAAGVNQVMEMSESNRSDMGQRGRKLVEERFTWPKVAAQMRQVYGWLLGVGPRPDSVVLS